MKLACDVGESQAEKFNYFVTDICVVLLSWAETAVPVEDDLHQIVCGSYSCCFEFFPEHWAPFD